MWSSWTQGTLLNTRFVNPACANWVSCPPGCWGNCWNTWLRAQYELYLALAETMTVGTCPPDWHKDHMAWSLARVMVVVEESTLAAHQGEEERVMPP